MKTHFYSGKIYSVSLFSFQSKSSFSQWRILRFFLFLLILLFLNALPTKAQTQKRALWVTRWDFKTEDDIRKIMENARLLGTREVLFQTRGNATVFYPSEIEPWAWELTGETPATTGKDPGWDPLNTAIEEAKNHNLELHAWINVFPGWRGLTPPPRSTEHPWVSQRSWFMIDHRGLPMKPMEKWYTFMSPGIPEVRKYIASLCGEMASQYPELAGIHLDYVRYPAHRETGSFRDFSYDKTSVEAFKKLHNILPRYDKEEWQQFKQTQVTHSIQAIRKAIQSASPAVELSATFVAEIHKATSEVGQDPRQWFDKDLVDWAVPMIYKRNFSSFQENVRQLQQHYTEAHLKKMAFGLNVDFNSIQTIQNQMGLSLRESNAGEVLFAYSSLFPNHTPNPKVNAIQKLWREARLREVLLRD